MSLKVEHYINSSSHGKSKKLIHLSGSFDFSMPVRYVVNLNPDHYMSSNYVVAYGVMNYPPIATPWAGEEHHPGGGTCAPKHRWKQSPRRVTARMTCILQGFRDLYG